MGTLGLTAMCLKKNSKLLQRMNGTYLELQDLFTPRRRGLISHAYLWGGGFQRYRKSFKIGHKKFYSQVNDKEW